MQLCSMLLFLVLLVNYATDFNFYLHTLTLAAHSYALLTKLIGMTLKVRITISVILVN